MRTDEKFEFPAPRPWRLDGETIRDRENGVVMSAINPANMETRSLIVRAVNERDTIINAHVILSGEVRELAAEAEKLKDLVRRMLPGVEENYAMAKSAAVDVKGICDLKGVDFSTVDAVLDMWRNIIAEAKEAIA